MLYLGIIIALGSAVAFVAVAALTLIGGGDTTQRQIIPGFVPDQPGPLERALTLLSYWAPIIFVAALCILVGIRIVELVINAL